jgi:hypothetical protein
MAGSRLKDAICVAQTVIDDLKNFNQALHRPVSETAEQFATFQTDEVARNAVLSRSVNFQPE